MVRLARSASVRNRRNFYAHLELFVALDGRFPGAAAFLAPDESKYIADVDVGVNHAEGPGGPFVVAVAAEHGKSHRLAALHHLVVGGGGIVGDRQVEELV